MNIFLTENVISKYCPLIIFLRSYENPKKCCCVDGYEFHWVMYSFLRVLNGLLLQLLNSFHLFLQPERSSLLSAKGAAKLSILILCRWYEYKS